MKYKKEVSLLFKSTEYRNKLIREKFLNFGKYAQIKDKLMPAIGEAVNIHILPIRPVMGDDSILEYTHSGRTEYAEKINSQYLYGITDVDSYEAKVITPSDYFRIKGERAYETLSVNDKGVLSDELGKDVKFHDEGYSDETVPDNKLHNIARGHLSDKDVFYDDVTPYVFTEYDGKGGVMLFPGVYDGLNEYGKPSSVLTYTNKFGESTYNVYGEGDVPQDAALVRTNEYNDFGAYTHAMRGENNLLVKTNKMYNEHKIKTLFGRHVTSDDDGYNMSHDSYDSAKLLGIGNPRGRGLLKLGVASGDRVPMTNGYYNPFCRSWSYHHQYMKIKDMIRPFSDEPDRDIYKINKRYRSNGEEGAKYLRDNTVLQRNGFVRITPSATEFGDVLRVADGKTPEHALKYMNLKKYMFSLENLAWSDGTSNNLNNLSLEQRGPNGGRIMWFPPYGLTFDESVSVNWNENDIIGRGEKIYTYRNTSRRGRLSFIMLIDHPAIINSVSSGRYKGEEPDLDPDADVLRFFAGCGMIDPDANMVSEITEQDIYDILGFSVTDTKPTVDNNDVGKEEPGEEKELSFYVFFPNNYSGCWNGGNNLVSGPSNSFIGDDIYNRRVDNKDGYWYKYLLCGKGTKYTDESGNFIIGNGYEMGGGGLSSGLDDNDILIHSTSSGETADWYVDPEKTYFTDEDPYRFIVDYDLRQLMKNKASYSDTTSYDLNYSTKSFSAAGLGNPTGDDNLFSFAEAMYMILYTFGGDTKIYGDSLRLSEIKSKFGNIADTGIDERLAEKLRELNPNMGRQVTDDGGFDSQSVVNNDGILVTSIKVEGMATSVDAKNSTKLAERRARCIYNTLKSLTGYMGFDGDISVNVPDSNSENISDLRSKACRCAKVTMKYKTTQVIKVNDDKFNDLNHGDGNKNLSDAKKEAYKDLRFEAINSLSDAQIMDLNTVNSRYDNEYRFFQKIKEENPMIYRKITDKVKYFDPAFHSMSPEGFNSRLTFLHQCTRQGHTVSVSETSGNDFGATAGNLAFGKMPVCVLRIGDFINTKVIIKSVNINYSGEGMVWDLNPEGVGVQPMFAKVDLEIDLIGGQSLEAPISRLQNAVSFNYYANTPAYDDRADKAKNDIDGNVTYERIYRPKL